MPEKLVVKNVENDLRKAHASKRQKGQIPYPLAYSRNIADFDIWNYMLLSNHCQSLTCHKFNVPPALTLDIGCGTGFWAIDAAKQWQNSKIIGFDIATVQPRLHEIEHQKALARRVKWVHGNLLDGLPFPNNHFDFVRMAEMGLAIPEDEWQSVLEEIQRVMKPNAVLEIIEEDLIFPCPSALIQRPKSPPSLSPPANHLHSLELFKNKSTTTFSDQSSTLTQQKSPMSHMASLASLHDLFKGTNRFSSQASLLVPDDASRYSPPVLQISPSSTQSSLDLEHPQDHTRVKASWDAMLATRFLSPKIVAVLPFYLTSSFIDTKIHPPLIIPLPPSSKRLTDTGLRTAPSMSSILERDRETREQTVSDVFFDIDIDFSPSISTRSSKADGCSFRSSVQSRPQPPAWDTMHLAKSLSTIRGCKEAIWEEYTELYYNEARAILMRTAPDEEDYDTQPYPYVVRTAFEVDWRNWEYDMLDRIQMRDSLSGHIPWIQATTKDELPPCQLWRQSLEREPGKSRSTSGHSVTAYNPEDLCRSLRVFTAFKY